MYAGSIYIYPPGSGSVRPSPPIQECAKICEILKRLSGSTTNICLINFSHSAKRDTYY